MATDGDTIIVKEGSYNVWCPTTDSNNYTGRDHNLFIGKNITIKGEGKVNIYSLQEEYKYTFDRFIVVLISGSNGVVLDNLNIFPVYYSPSVEGLPSVNNSDINSISGKDTLSVYYNQIIETLTNYNGKGSTSNNNIIENLVVQNCTIGDPALDSAYWGSPIYLPGYVNGGKTGIRGGYTIENNTFYGYVSICEGASENATSDLCQIKDNIFYGGIIFNGKRKTGWNDKSLTVFPTVAGNTFMSSDWTITDKDGNSYNAIIGSRDIDSTKILTQDQLREMAANNYLGSNFGGKVIGTTIGVHTSYNNDEYHAVVYAGDPVAKIGDKNYGSLQAAIAAATDGDTITLLSDCETTSKYSVTSPLTLNKTDVTLDLNGKTLTVTNNFSFVINGDRDVVKNGTIQAGSNSEKKTGINSYALVLNGCDGVVIENVTSNGGISVGGSTGETPSAASATNAVIKNCNVTSGDYYAVCAQQNSTVTIESGTFTADSRSDNAGVLQGTFIGTDGPKGTITVTGGTFNGNINKNNQGDLVFKGGTFTSDPTAYVSANSNYYVKNNADNTYTVYYSAPYVPSTPTTPTDNVTNSGTSGTDNATTSADLSNTTSTSNGTTASTVDKTTADKIVDKAVANESSEIVIDATANSTTASNSTTIAQVTIPTETLGAIAEKTEADVTIKTDVAEVKLDNASAAAVADQATGDTVQIIAEKVKEDATEVHFELKVVCSNGTVISDFKGGNVSVTVTLPKTMAEKKLVCVYIDDQGHMSKVEGQKNADGTYTFTTTHFSTYAIMAEDEADAAIAAQTEAIKNIKIKLSSKQIKTKSGKKAVKVTWTAAAGDKTLDGVEVYRSTQRYKGYGKEPFFTSTKGGNKGSYINTKSLKKGTRYYYRVRGYILVNGEKVYTDYSTKAWRTVR